VSTGAVTVWLVTRIGASAPETSGALNSTATVLEPPAGNANTGELTSRFDPFAVAGVFTIFVEAR
jgi:hypothetical protein